MTILGFIFLLSIWNRQIDQRKSTRIFHGHPEFELLKTGKPSPHREFQGKFSPHVAIFRGTHFWASQGLNPGPRPHVETKTVQGQKRKYMYLKETIAGRVLCLKRSSISDKWKRDIESIQSSTRSAPSSLAFAIDFTISSLFSLSIVAHNSRLFLKPIWVGVGVMQNSKSITDLPYISKRRHPLDNRWRATPSFDELVGISASYLQRRRAMAKARPVRVVWRDVWRDIQTMEFIR
ncbi:hypothetical protein LXL04_018859 [Taraxacum kok-saghyz]